MLQDEMPMVNFHLGLAMSVDADHVVHLNFGDGLVARFLARFGSEVNAASAVPDAMETLRFRKYSSRVNWVIGNWTEGLLDKEIGNADLVIASHLHARAQLKQLHNVMQARATLCLTHPASSSAQHLTETGFSDVQPFVDWKRTTAKGTPVVIIATK